jgi:hypothetical protein
MVCIGLDPDGSSCGGLCTEGFFEIFLNIPLLVDPLSSFSFSRFKYKNSAIPFSGMIKDMSLGKTNGPDIFDS